MDRFKPIIYGVLALGLANTAEAANNPQVLSVEQNPNPDVYRQIIAVFRQKYGNIGQCSFIIKPFNHYKLAFYDGEFSISLQTRGVATEIISTIEWHDKERDGFPENASLTERIKLKTIRKEEFAFTSNDIQKPKGSSRKADLFHGFFEALGFSKQKC